MCEQWREEKVGNGLDSERGVGSGLDRGCVGVVDDDRRSTSNVPYPSTSKDDKSTTATTTGTRSENGNVNHKMSQATQPAYRTPGTTQ